MEAILRVLFMAQKAASETVGGVSIGQHHALEVGGIPGSRMDCWGRREIGAGEIGGYAHWNAPPIRDSVLFERTLQ